MKAQTKTLAQAGGFSAAALALAGVIVAASEGKRNDPYKDMLAGGIWTVCYGDTHVPMRRYSDAECKALLTASLKKHGDQGIAKCLPAGLPDATQAAFLSVGYNVGVQGFCRSSMSRKAWAGDLKGACASISLYQFVGGKDCRNPANRCAGIPKRRADERALCEQGLQP